MGLKHSRRDAPIRFDPDGRFDGGAVQTLFIYLTAGRMAYNFSGVWPMMPLGPAALAAYLKQQGHPDNAALDQPGWGLSEAGTRRLLLDHPFDIYALSANLFSLAPAARLARFIKERAAPDALVVIGGPSAAFAPELILKECPAVDAVQVGEGEAAMAEIVRRRGAGEPIRDIPGLRWRENGRIRSGGAPVLLDLSVLPLPARHLFPAHRHHMHPPFGAFGRAASVETIRGCHYGCKFCSIQQTVRFRPVDAVIDEMSGLIRTGFREFHFIDPTFSIDLDRAARLCEALIRRLPRPVFWTCKNRIDTVTPDLLKLMRRAGCYMISYGVESGDDRVLARLRKNLTAADIRRTLRATRAASIRTLAYILIGAPGETRESVRRTVDLLKTEKTDFALFGELMPDTESPLFREMILSGRLSKNAVGRLVLTGDPTSLFSGTPSGRDRATLARWLSEANRRFYLRPGYVAERLAGLLSARDGINMARGAGRLGMEFMANRSPQPSSE